MRIDTDAVKSLLTTNKFGRTAEFIEVAESTNSEALKLCKNGTPEGTAVFCGRQTAGRGRRGRRWDDRNGATLCFSVTADFSGRMNRAARAVIACGIAICNAVNELYGIDAGLKWPNDVMVNGKKLAGVLCEADPAGNVVMGMGINFAGDGFSKNIGQPAISLEEAAGMNVAPEKLAAGILNGLEVLMAEIRDEEGFSRIKAGYNALSLTVGRRVKIVGTGAEYAGRAVGIDDIGRLVVETDDGTAVTVNEGDVTIASFD